MRSKILPMPVIQFQLVRVEVVVVLNKVTISIPGRSIVSLLGVFKIRFHSKSISSQLITRRRCVISKWCLRLQVWRFFNVFNQNVPFFKYIFFLYSISVVSNSVANVTTTSSGTKFPTALVLETIEENETVYYLIPKHLAKKGRLKKKGTKLHVCQDHMFVAKHIKSGSNCSVCQKKMSGRLGKKTYACRDCGLTCHKDCFDKTQESCSKSTLSSLELLRGSTLFKKKGP